MSDRLNRFMFHSYFKIYIFLNHYTLMLFQTHKTFVHLKYK